MKISIKKFFLITFILLEVFSVMAFASVNAVPVPVVPDASISIKPRVTFSFTIARRRDCEGFGICNWDVTVSMGKMNNCTASITVDDFNKGILILEIDKSKGLRSEAYNKYFSSGTFLMEDDSPVPGEIVSALGLAGSKILAAGKHKVTERNGILYISIPLK